MSRTTTLGHGPVHYRNGLNTPTEPNTHLRFILARGYVHDLCNSGCEASLGPHGADR